MNSITYKIKAFSGVTLAAFIGCASTPSNSNAAGYYTDSGGRGMTLGVLVPEGRGLNENQAYIPSVVQGGLVSNISKYSAITVLDRISLDKVIAETLDPTYEDNLDIVRLGHVAQVGYMLTGNINRTSTGYTLQLNVTETKGGTLAASFSGTCTIAQFDDFSAINLASKELLTKMGIQLTDAAINELGRSNSIQSVNAQTNLARGIVAQQQGTVVEAMNYFYNAVSFDTQLLEAQNRLSELSARISSGNIGDNARNDIQRRNEWMRILTEAEDFFTKHPPFEIIYSGSLSQGRIDYAGETVQLKISITLCPSENFKVFNDILTGLASTGKMAEWNLAYWPATSAALFSRRTGYRDYFPERYDERDSAEKDIDVTLALTGENGNVISIANISLNSKIRFSLIGMGETSKEKVKSPITMYYNNRFYGVDITKLEATEYQGEIVFTANAYDITDNLIIKIVSVNGVDTAKNAGYIKITAR